MDISQETALRYKNRYKLKKTLRYKIRYKIKIQKNICADKQQYIKIDIS